MRAVHPGSGRQAAQAVERGQHLRGRAFEQAAAAGGEQRIAAEQQGLARPASGVVSDMPQGVAGDVQDFEVESEFRHGDAIAVAQRMGHAGNRLAGRTPDRDARVGQKFDDAAGVIGMMVRD